MRYSNPVRLGKTKLPFYRLVGTVSNCADAGRLQTAPTGERKCLFIFSIHHSAAWYSVLNCSVCYIYLPAIMRLA